MHQTISNALLVCILLLVAIPQLLAAAQHDGSHPPDFAAIDAFIEAELRSARIPGMALGIVQGERIVHLQSFGVADPSGRPVTPQTPFHIASVTKPFTVLPIMQLVEQGKLDLDAPVQRSIPWFRVADPDASARITIRHLLTHTSGLQASVAGQQNGDRTIEQLVRDLRNARLTQPLGTVRQYCSVDCFAVLGLIVQVVSGQPYEKYV
jgi:CubicO group peptidase (beta-lactamase class C family)